MQIIKCDKKALPSLKFIGKRYSHDENFGAKWGEWWQNGWFGPLENLGESEYNDASYIGAKRIVGGMLEYWIGMFFDESKQAPEGFDEILIPACDYSVMWIQGEDDWRLTSYDAHVAAVSEMEKNGHKRRDDDWCFEFYNCPRYTTPDENGLVILDYYVAIE